MRRTLEVLDRFEAAGFHYVGKNSALPAIMNELREMISDFGASLILDADVAPVTKTPDEYRQSVREIAASVGAIKKKPRKKRRSVATSLETETPPLTRHEQKIG
jgi:hypothetical protein